ncbi:MAG: ABC transporter ATP-binding protein, partial [Xanthomonadales bacterium]|nr:ABC transporter ATP-binding protein [Xanthomonadales bacterium]
MDDKTPDPVLLDIQNLNKSYGDTQVLSNCRLQVRAGEILALLGASGCGKSTLLRLIAGLESPDNKQPAAHQLACDDSKQTKLYLAGQDIMHWPPYRRPVNMMFQSYALFPHLNVRDNIAFGLRYEQQTCARLNKAQQKVRVNEVLALVKLEEQAKRYPHQLSGGQCQRVALARALVKQPQLLLLDEPMAALDHQLRQQTQKELRKLQQRLGISFILVTHDRTEAMAMADRIAIMDAGRVVQIDTPKRLYEQPNSRFVAEFLGAVNCFPVQVLECAQQAPDQ